MHDLDSLVGTEPSLERRIVGRAHYLARKNPDRLPAFIAGVALQGIAIPAGLAPFIKLPPAEPRTHKRARMAQTMQQLYAANGVVMVDDLKAQNFDEIEIRDLGREAARIAGIDRMAA